MSQYPFSNNDVNPSPFLWMNVDCGPSIGLVRRPMFAERILTAADDIIVVPFDFQVIVKKAVPAPTAVYLPDLALWMSREWGGMPLLIMDGGQNASTYNITITPFGSQTINLQPTWTIAADGGSVLLRPLVDRSGWIV